MSEALYRKYRPQTFADVTDQEHVKVTIRNQIAAGAPAHAYLFTGPRGIGKTTVARLVAKAVNCLKQKEGEPCNKCKVCEEVASGRSLDVHEIDAASHTDVENVRENIIKSVRFAPNKLKYRVYIIDEVHMLSTSAFNALLKTLEEPPAHGLFILATTEIHKVPATIISRCQRFDFHRISTASLVKRLAAITKEEGVSVSPDVLAEVARHADGCARDAESLLGQILSLGEKKITMDEASLVLPATTDVLVADFVESLLAKKTAEAVRLVNGYVEQGVDMAHFVDDVIDVLRALLFAKLGGEVSRMEKLEEKARERLKAALGSASPAWITRAIEVFLEARRAVKTDKIPQLGVEIAIVKVCEPDFQHREAGLELVKGSQVRRVAGAQEPQRDSSSVSANLRTSHFSEPVDIKTTVFENVPVVSLDEVKTKWPEVFQQIKECHATLPIVMQAGEITVVEGDAVEFSFQYALHADTINQARNRQLLEDTLSRVLGKRVRVRAKYAHADADETVSNLLQKFGGSVV